MKGETYLCLSKNVRKIRENGLNVLVLQIPHVPMQLSTAFLAIHVLEISDCGGQCLVSVSLKPGKAHHQTGTRQRGYACTTE